MSARTSDPETSHMAAAEIAADGSKFRMQQIVIACVKKTPGLTASELQVAHPTVTGAIWKRLAEVERQGYIYRGQKRQSDVPGAKAGLTWWPTVEENST